MKYLKPIFLVFSLLLIYTIGFAREKKTEPAAYVFKIDHQVKHTPIKSQDTTGTCWCFSTISFLESELLRLGREEIDLSEMFIARQTYPHKALNYIRLHGKATFSQGGLCHDVFETIKNVGIVPEEVYPGNRNEKNRHHHTEMFTVLKSMIDAVLKKGVTSNWKAAFEAVLDIYLGQPPETFSYNGKIYTPQSFAAEFLPLNLNNYIELTSFTHHSFYQQFRLEIPDNWSCNSRYFNVPIDDLERIVDYALKNGHSIAWDGDFSEKNYATKKTGYAIVPLDRKDEKAAEEEQEITRLIPEKVITQELRQKTFDNFSTVDDHLMHIVGIAHDQAGTKFYLAKDSWDTTGKYQGYIYLSRSYFRLKTISIMMNREALPDDIKLKLMSE